MGGATDEPVEMTLPVLPPSAAVLIADDEARFQEVNEAAVHLLKYSEPELKQMHVWDITAPAQRDAAKLMWKDFIRQGRQAGVYQVRRSDGREVTVQYEATANFQPGRHISILQASGPATPGSRPLDECPFHRPFPLDFDRCPAYEPRLVQMADSREQPVGQVWTCDHLATSKMPAQSAYYGRCALGDAPQRSHWLEIAAEHGLLSLRKLRMEFYSEARSAIGRLLSVQNASRSGASLRGTATEITVASDSLLAALASFMERRRRDLIESGIDPPTLQRAVEATINEATRQRDINGLRPSEQIIREYPVMVQAFLRPDLVAVQMLQGAPRS